jgi:hypothetical protein
LPAWLLLLLLLPMLMLTSRGGGADSICVLARLYFEAPSWR